MGFSFIIYFPICGVALQYTSNTATRGKYAWRGHLYPYDPQGNIVHDLSISRWEKRMDKIRQVIPPANTALNYIKWWWVCGEKLMNCHIPRCITSSICKQYKRISRLPQRTSFCPAQTSESITWWNEVRLCEKESWCDEQTALAWWAARILNRVSLKDSRYETRESRNVAYVDGWLQS